MNDNEKWFEQLSREWPSYTDLHEHSSGKRVTRLIAYVEELREALNVKFIPSGIARNKLDAMRAILQSHYQVCIEEPDTFAVDRIRELEEENKKLKEEFTDYQKWARNCCDLLEEENSKLKEEVEEEREVKFSVMKTCKQYREVNAKLKEELRIERIER